MVDQLGRTHGGSAWPSQVPRRPGPRLWRRWISLAEPAVAQFGRTRGGSVEASLDKIIAALRSGLTRREASERFGVSEFSVIRFARRDNREGRALNPGTCTPRPNRDPRRGGHGMVAGGGRAGAGGDARGTGRSPAHRTRESCLDSDALAGLAAARRAQGAPGFDGRNAATARARDPVPCPTPTRTGARRVSHGPDGFGMVPSAADFR
jgi:hypothetical protein